MRSLEASQLPGAAQDADFHGAHLEKALFVDAQLQEADFSDALGLTRPQLSVAQNVDKAVLPAYVTKAQESESAVPPAD